MRNYLILIGLVLLFLFVGCSNEQPVSNLNSEQTIEAKELPPTLAKKMERYMELDRSVIPDLQRSPGNNNMNVNDSIYDVYSVVILWGDILGMDPGLPPVDWSGSLSVNGEVSVEASYTIAFEDGEDSVLVDDLPNSAFWVSETHHDVDGIHFTVLYDKTVQYFTPPMLTLTTPLFSHSWNFEQLKQLAEFYPVPPVSGIAILSKQIIIQDCDHGILQGTWFKDSLVNIEAHFNGLWIDNTGDTVGIYSGIVYTDTNGVNILEGNISGLVTDQVIANLYGTWGYDDERLCPMCGEGHGYFMGVYEYVSGDVNGHFAGEFGDYSLPPLDITMPMSGHWRQRCAHMDFNTDMHD